MADIKKIKIGETIYNLKDEAARALLNTKQDAISYVDVDDSQAATVGTPEVTADFVDGQMTFAFKNLKGEKGNTGAKGDKGDQGDSVMIAQGDLPLTHVIGEDNTKAMSQKGVTTGLTVDSYDLYLTAASNKYTTYINGTTNLWYSSSGYESRFYPVVPGTYIKIVGNASAVGYYAFLRDSSHTTGEPPAWVDGVSARTGITANAELLLQVPSQANWLWIADKHNNTSNIPQRVTVAKTLRDLAEEGKTYIVEPLPRIYVSSYISASGANRGKWHGSGSYSASIVPVNAGDNIIIKTQEGKAAFYSFLKSNERTTGAVADFADGYDSLVPVAIGATITVPVPDTAKFMYVAYLMNNESNWPDVFGVVKKIDDVTDDLYNANEERKNVDWIAVGGEDYYTSQMEVGTYIRQQTNKWKTPSNTVRRGVFIPVVPGDKLKVVCDWDNKPTFGAFLTSDSHTDGDDVQFVQGESVLQFLTGKTYLLDVPTGAKFLYVQTKWTPNDSSATVQDCKPHIYWLTSVHQKVTDMAQVGPYMICKRWDAEYGATSINANGELEPYTGSDTYIVSVREYTIEQGKLYYANTRGGSARTLPTVAYYDEYDVFIGFDEMRVPKGVELVDYQVKLNVPTGAAKVRILGTSVYESNSNITTWPAQLYEATWTPFSRVGESSYKVEFHSVKIQGYQYEEDGVTVVSPMPPSFPTEDPTNAGAVTRVDVESPWAVMWPNSYTPHGTPTPVVAMLHGSEGFVHYPYMGYNSSSVPTWGAWRKKYTNEGWAVIDINGIAESSAADADDNSRHFGCPSAIQTLDKAFEYLKANYNVCDKMLVHGTSMGGALALNYAKAFPKKVTAVALFAPAFGIKSLTINASRDHVSRLFGYTGITEAMADNFAKAAGWVLFSKCLAWKDGALIEMPWNDLAATIVEDTAAERKAANELSYTYGLIDHLDVPVRCWQGTADVKIVKESSQHLIASLLRGNTQASLRLVEGAGHSMCTGDNNYLFVRQEAVDFFRQHLYNE